MLHNDFTKLFFFSDFTKLSLRLILPNKFIFSQGDIGQRGKVGIKGEKGAPGFDGMQGERGEKGEQGIRGVAGPQGIVGIDGQKVRIISFYGV